MRSLPCAIALGFALSISGCSSGSEPTSPVPLDPPLVARDAAPSHPAPAPVPSDPAGVTLEGKVVDSGTRFRTVTLGPAWNDEGGDAGARVAISPEGEALAAWEEPGGRFVRIAARHPGHEWTTVGAFATGEVWIPAIAVAAGSGLRAVAAWERDLPHDVYQVVVTVRDAQGRWSRPRDLPGGGAWPLAAAMTTDGHAVVFGGGLGAKDDLWLAVDNGHGRFGRPTPLHLTGRHSEDDPDIAIAGSGKWIAAWSTEREERLRVALGDLNGTVTPPQTIASGDVPQVAINSRGDAALLWVGDLPDVEGWGVHGATHRGDGGGWTADRTLSFEPGGERAAVQLASASPDPTLIPVDSDIIYTASLGSVAVSSDGRVVALWCAEAYMGAADTQAAEADAGADWSRSITLAPGCGESAVATAADGITLAVWPGYTNRTLLEVARRTGPGRWTKPQTVERTRRDVMRPLLALGDNGLAVALWQLNTDSTGVIRAATTH